MGSGVGGGGLPVGNEENGKGVERAGGGVGTSKGTGKSMRMRWSKLPFSKLPFDFFPINDSLDAKTRVQRWHLTLHLRFA